MQGFLKIRGCSKMLYTKPHQATHNFNGLRKRCKPPLSKIVHSFGSHLKVHFFFSQIERLKTYKGTLKLLPNPVRICSLYTYFAYFSICLSFCLCFWNISVLKNGFSLIHMIVPWYKAWSYWVLPSYNVLSFYTNSQNNTHNCTSNTIN